MAFGKPSFTPRAGKTKVAPSTYPKLIFHGLRCAQLLSSMIVGSIMFYFIYHLSHDHWNTPWTFIFFAAASSFTILALTVTIVLHCCVGLNPRFNLAVNSALFALWAAGFGMLSWWASRTLFHQCDRSNQIGDDDIGRMVCRIYKALYSFALLGFLSTLAALVLDVVVFKKATRLGKYRNMQEDEIKLATEPVYHDQTELAGYNSQVNANQGKAGYNVPANQFSYDTSYGGGNRYGS